MTTESNTSVKPEQVSKEEADRLNDYAQNLDDPITKVVDYGSLDSDEPKRKKK